MYAGVRSRDGGKVAIKHVAKAKIKEWGQVSTSAFSYFSSPRTEMTAENLRWLENVFRQTVGENGEIRLQDFKNIVHSKNVSPDRGQGDVRR